MKLSEALRNQLDFTMSDYVEVNVDVIDEVEALENQIEKMKCCDNCLYCYEVRIGMPNIELTKTTCWECEDYSRWQMKEVEDEKT